LQAAKDGHLWCNESTQMRACTRRGSDGKAPHGDDAPAARSASANGRQEARRPAARLAQSPVRRVREGQADVYPRMRRLLEPERGLRSSRGRGAADRPVACKANRKASRLGLRGAGALATRGGAKTQPCCLA